MKPATQQQWLDACGMAWTMLCQGDGELHVDREKETFENAIARVAGRLLTERGLGRERGPVPEEWAVILEGFADRKPPGDGLVATRHGVRVAPRNLLRGRQFAEPSN